MAKPIELGLVLEGKDAKEFFRNEKSPVVSKELVGLLGGQREYMRKTGFNFCLLLFKILNLS